MKEMRPSGQPEQKNLKELPEISIDPVHPPRLLTVRLDKEALQQLIDEFGYHTPGPKQIIFRGDFWTEGRNTYGEGPTPFPSDNPEEFLLQYLENPDTHAYLQDGRYDGAHKIIYINVDTIAAHEIISNSDNGTLAMLATKRSLTKALVHELHHALDPKTPLYTWVKPEILLPTAYTVEVALLGLASLYNKDLSLDTVLALGGMITSLINLHKRGSNHQQYLDAKVEKVARAAAENPRLTYLAAHALTISETSWFQHMGKLSRILLSPILDDISLSDRW